MPACSLTLSSLSRREREEKSAFGTLAALSLREKGGESVARVPKAGARLKFQ